MKIIWNGWKHLLPDSVVNTRDRWTPERCGSPPAEPGQPADWQEQTTVFLTFFTCECFYSVSLTSVQSDSADSPSWERRIGGSGRSPHHHCSFPRFQRGWDDRSSAGGCGKRGRCPGPSCCSGSSGSAKGNIRGLMKNMPPLHHITEITDRISPPRQSRG